MNLKSIIAAAVLSAVGTFASAQTYDLKIASFVTPKHGMSKWIDGWAASLEEKSEGRLKFEILHGAQMGPPPAYYDLASNGQADIAWVLHGATPGRFKLTEISNMPYLFCSAEQATRVLNDPSVRALTDPEHRGVKVLTTFMHPPGQINMKGGPVLALSDLAGKAMRPPSKTVGQLIAMLGGKPVGLPPTAMAEALQKGTIDGTMIDYGGAGLAFQLGPFLTDITEVYAYTSSFALVMNPDSFGDLPADLQAMVDESLVGISPQIGQIWDKLDAIGKDVLTKAGVNIHTLSDEETAKFQAVGAAQTAGYLASLNDAGLPADDVMSAIKAAIEAVGPVGPGCQS
ncbi:MAG: TRAP transporter substrate-binding protein [Ascidiaceihabitans sp.]|uniref:TRAP transporter substrate-binding protein n=1 Tax=Ascidiaceihabitans sp. TaxID=1872644 RepID=UPI0032969FA3